MGVGATTVQLRLLLLIPPPLAFGCCEEAAAAALLLLLPLLQHVDGQWPALLHFVQNGRRCWFC